MNTNIILDGVSAILNQLIAAAVAEAIKPLQDRINMLETQVACSFDDEKKMVGDRLTALEINQTLVSPAKGDFSEAIRNVLDEYNFINRNDVVDLVDKVVENAIDNYDFSESFDFEAAIENYDFSDKIEEGINNYDFSEIVEENMPDLCKQIETYDFSNIVSMHMPDDLMNEERVQDMINESLDNLSISRN